MSISRESSATLVEILESQASSRRRVLVLHHEEQVEDLDRPIVHELSDRGCYTARELVAEANDVDVDRADFIVSPSFGLDGA